jgi:pimeloyl-ACP methyl ester carboxylesterase
LQEDGFTVLTPSRPGYRRTPLSTGVTPEQAADACASLLQLLSIEQVCVMGTSGGGPTALQFVLRHPRRVCGLILQSAISQRFVEPPRSTRSFIGRIVFSRRGKWLADFAVWVALLLARYWPSLIIRSLLDASDNLDPPRFRRRFSAIRVSPEQMAFFQRLVRTGAPLSPRQAGLWNDLRQFAGLTRYPLESVCCPTLVVHGQADGNVPFAHAQFAATTVPGAELLAIEDCGHFIWVGPDAARTRQRVAEFLRRLNDPGRGPCGP